jgi:phosphoglycolate phosphatase
VEESLRNLRMRGVRIVAHTEALFQNAYYRLIKLGLVDLIDRLYTSTTALPPAPNVSIMQPRSDFVSLLGEHERKPDPQVVLDICAKEKVDPVAAVYVGDSLTRDVAMAVNAGVTAVWARYGRSFAQDDWNYLVRITHWTAEDVAYEERLRAHSAAVEPNLIIDRFSGIMGLFDSATRSAYIAR